MSSPIGFLTTSSLLFSGEGDFTLENNDIKLIQGSLETRVQSLKDLLRTSYGDYFYFKSLGADIESYLGRGVDTTLQLEVENHIKNVIITSLIFDASEFTIYSLVDIDTIHIRIFISEDTDEEETIDLTYKTETGVKLG